MKAGRPWINLSNSGCTDVSNTHGLPGKPNYTQIATAQVIPFPGVISTGIDIHSSIGTPSCFSSLNFDETNRLPPGIGILPAVLYRSWVNTRWRWISNDKPEQERETWSLSSWSRVHLMTDSISSWNVRPTTISLTSQDSSILIDIPRFSCNSLINSGLGNFQSSSLFSEYTAR